MYNSDFPIIREFDFYYSVETEHFYFDVYKAWNGAGGGAMFRAGSYVKRCNGRKFSLDCDLFAEWDYKDKEEAFNAAKLWLNEYIKRLSKELCISNASEPLKEAQQHV